MTRRRTNCIAGLTAAVGVAAAVAFVPISPASAVAPGTWTKLSTSQVPGTQRVGLARFGTQLQIAWVQGSPPNMHLMTRVLNSSGHPVSAPVDVLGGAWSSLDQSVVVLPYNGSRLIAFVGTKNNGSAYDGGVYYATSGNGTSWTLGTGSMSHATIGVAGITGINHAGTPIIAWPNGANIAFHVGIDPNKPATAIDGSLNQEACCTSEVGLGINANTGAVDAVWNSDASGEGLHAAALYPTKGAVHAAPGSTTDPSNLGEQLASRPKSAGGGVYAAYSYGSTFTKIAIWKLGAAKPTLLIKSGSNEKVSIAAGLAGRLWVWWYNRSTGVIHVVRTNKAVTHLGTVRTLKPPGGPLASVASLWGIGSRATLDLTAVSSKGNSIPLYVWHTQVLAGMKGTVSPAKIKSSTGGTITVHVTDARTPLANVRVVLGKRVKHTNRKGIVRFAIAKHTHKGKKTITYSHAGYATGHLHFRVT